MRFSVAFAQERGCAEVGVMAGGALLGVVAAVGFFAKILWFVVTIDAHLKNRHDQEEPLLAAVGQVAHQALALRHGRMADAVREKIRVAGLAPVQEVIADVHASVGIVAIGALPLHVGRMIGDEPRLGQHQFRRFGFLGRGVFANLRRLAVLGDFEEKVFQPIACGG